uniref:EGF-like domain-containing protein n=1 Tax=Caenorhabditis japonica TaxID=281687 RepID=A0A8R1EY24_CAEJA
MLLGPTKFPDIDECRGYKAVCDRNAWCVNEIGSYRCECMASYRGDGKHCTYVGLGRSSINCQDCSPDATCMNGVCQCKEGYEGDGFNCTGTGGLQTRSIRTVEDAATLATRESL